MTRVSSSLRVNDVPVAAGDFARRVEAIRPLVEKHEASWFETLTAVSVQLAAEAQVDVLDRRLRARGEHLHRDGIARQHFECQWSDEPGGRLRHQDPDVGARPDKQPDEKSGFVGGYTPGDRQQYLSAFEATFPPTPAPPAAPHTNISLSRR